jgi:hypothetical protein
MKAKLALVVLLLGSAALPASAQLETRYDLAPGALVNLVTRLYRPVSLDLHNVTVGQAVQALAHEAGVRIFVDGHVPADARVSLSARVVPLGVALQQVAQQANLLIVPASTTNVWLNRIDQELGLVPGTPAASGVATPNAPWSNEWGLNPISGAFPSTGVTVQPEGAGGAAGARM